MLEMNKEYTYKGICEGLGWNLYTGGNSKKAQIKEIEAAYEFYHPINKKTHKEKKSYIFTRKKHDPVEPSKSNCGGVHNTKAIQPMMDYLMMKCPADYMYRSITTWLCDELSLMNKETYNMPYSSKYAIESFCTKNCIKNAKLFCDYISVAKSIMKQMFLKALSTIQKQDFIYYEDGYMFTYLIGEWSLGHFNTNELNEIIKQNETVICNEMNEEYKLSNKLSGRQLLLVIYRSEEYTKIFDAKKVFALMEDKDALKIMNDCIEDRTTFIGDITGRTYIGEKNPLLSYYRGIAIESIEGLAEMDGIEMSICNAVRVKARQKILSKHYKNRHTGSMIYPYSKFECATDMVIIEKLLFRFYDENLVDDTALDLVILDDELEELFRETRNIWGEPNPFDVFIEEAV